MKRLAALLALVITIGASAQTYLILDSSTAPVSLPSGWAETLLDGGVRTITSSSLTYNAGAGQWTISHTGGEAWSMADHTRSATYSLSGDVTLTGRVVTHDQDGDPINPESALGLRESTNANSANVRIGFVGNVGTHVKERASTGGSTVTLLSQDSPPTMPDCLRVEVDSALTSYRLYSSTDCASYTQIYADTYSWLSGTYQLWMLSTPSDFGDAGWSTTSVFDSIVVDTSAVDHSSPQTIDFSPISYSVDEDGTSVTVSMQRNGSASGVCNMFLNTVDGTALAGVDYTALVNDTSIQFADMVGGTDTATITITDRANNNGTRQFTVVATKDSCAGDTLTNDTATITINDTDTGTTLTWVAQGDAACTGGRQPYYPGLRGFAACTQGGFVSGTQIVFISNTNATGAGSIEDFVNASCPKVGIFTTSGVIEVDGRINMPTGCNQWSLVGESAPSPGILFRDTSIRMRGNNAVISHVTIAPGDQTSPDWDSCSTGVDCDRDAILLQNTMTDVLIANVTGMWAVDETFSCYAAGNVQRVSIWQSAVINPLYDSIHPKGFHSTGIITNETCFDFDVNRVVFVNTGARHPLLRSDDSLVVNTIGYNGSPAYWNQWITVNNLPASAPVATETNIIRNLWIHGPDSDLVSDPIEIRNDWNASSTVWEAGNSASWEDCSSNGCVGDGVTGDPLAVAELANAMPSGLEEETFTVGNAASEQAFISQIIDHVGANPTIRLTHTQTALDYVTDGYSNNTEGGLVDSVALDGGWITLAENSVDHTDGASTPCGGTSNTPIPTGSNKDDVMTSGLTRLHEWAISCADARMPAGWRPNTLELYPAP